LERCPSEGNQGTRSATQRPKRRGGACARRKSRNDRGDSARADSRPVLDLHGIPTRTDGPKAFSPPRATKTVRPGLSRPRRNVSARLGGPCRTTGGRIRHRQVRLERSKEDSAMNRIRSMFSVCGQGYGWRRLVGALLAAVLLTGVLFPTPVYGQFGL